MDMKSAEGIPTIDVIKNLICLTFTFGSVADVLRYPRHEMVLKGSFDNLMEQVGCEEYVDVGARELMCERL